MCTGTVELHEDRVGLAVEEGPAPRFDPSFAKGEVEPDRKTAGAAS
jgi:hypothetical protein